jgi:hypothetical protein
MATYRFLKDGIDYKESSCFLGTPVYCVNIKFGTKFIALCDVFKKITGTGRFYFDISRQFV